MRIILAILLLSAALPSSAKPIFIDFKLTQLEAFGDTRPGLYAGSWSFDDSLATPGGLFEDFERGRRLHSFSFGWLGRRWNPSNVRLARLEFDMDGELRSWIIGGSVISGGCGTLGRLDCVGIPSLTTDFYLAGTRLEPGIPPPEVVAVGVRPGLDAFAEARGTFTVRNVPVPAPGTLPLLGAGLLGIAFAGRARVRPRSRSS